MSPKTTPLRRSAKGESCTLNVAGICNHNPETVVLCHLPILADHGFAMKVADYCAAYGCSDCHDWIDNRKGVQPYEERLYYAARGLVRTQSRMIEKGLIVVKGVAA
jgi:hypothetical protein